MQTFLPYADFASSAAVLDQARLGKQRVETLQTLRALVIPDYGWRSHPAIRMWMGYVPALTLYGLAMVDEWVSRGHHDSTGHQILEFAPEVLDEPDVAMPPWLGDLTFHLSHQSNLVQKASGIYRGRFPGVPEDLAYVWPEPAEVLLPADPVGSRLWIWRAQAHPPDGVADLLMPPGAPGPPGRKPGKWERQLEVFEESLTTGDTVAIADPDGERFRLGTVGPVLMHEDGLLRTASLHGWLTRQDFDPPALLQDPRTLFSVALPAALR
ncbi:MSMEG_6728 family protein [Arthrobacter sp. Br18]|uniref:MSMEG_6728 family protein n=1 Tax=Arthrobacter sp. Br18 TaxID=1312954 RepID=UPI000479459B|nr:MSMEG_6728 family protein [Arthrobacter sp. Br18]